MTVCPLCLVKLCACFCCFLFACVSLFHLGPFELTHYCIPFLCSEHFLSPAIDMSSSQGSAASASSSSAQPPKPGQQLPEPDLELEGELINADTANNEVPKPGDTQSRLQHAIVALCLRHKPSESIEPRMLRVFLDSVVLDAYRIQPKDTLPAMLMHKLFSNPVLTTREAVGKTSPSEHETSYGV